MAKGIASGLAESDGIVFKTIPPARYPARVVNVQDAVSSAQSAHPGTPMVKVEIRISSDDPAIDGNKLFQNFMLPNAPWMTDEDNRKSVANIKRMYIACGLSLDDDEYDTDDWMGCELSVVVSEKEYPVGSGKMTNNISDMLPCV